MPIFELGRQNSTRLYRIFRMQIVQVLKNS